MRKIIGITLMMIGTVIATINLLLKVKRQISVSIIGGANGPTSVSVAGKIGGIPTILGIIVGIVLFAAGLFMIIRKK